jgi:purine-binding chemotaxis protein CheW
MPATTVPAARPLQKEENLQLLVFTLGGEEYGFTLTDASEIILPTKITPIPNSPESIKGVLNLRGRVVTIVDLGEHFHFPVQDKQDKKHIIVVDHANETFGILVDSVTEVLRTAKEQLRDTPKTLQGNISSAVLSGMVVLEGELTARKRESNEGRMVEGVPEEGKEEGKEKVKTKKKKSSTEDVEQGLSRIILLLNVSKILSAFGGLSGHVPLPPEDNGLNSTHSDTV